MTRSTVTADEAAFLTLTEAAERAGRSYSWARDCAVDGRLDARRLGRPARIYVTATSLNRLLFSEQFPKFRQHVDRTRGAHLRLVVSNS